MKTSNMATDFSKRITSVCSLGGELEGTATVFDVVRFGDTTITSGEKIGLRVGGLGMPDPSAFLDIASEAPLSLAMFPSSGSRGEDGGSGVSFTL